MVLDTDQDCGFQIGIVKTHVFFENISYQHSVQGICFLIYNDLSVSVNVCSLRHLNIRISIQLLMVVDGLVSCIRFHEPDHGWIKPGNVYLLPQNLMCLIYSVSCLKNYQNEQP